MRSTLLEMTQQVLSAMDSDEVNSISDTVESAQVASLIKQVYYDLITDLELTEHETVFQLNASGDNTKPCQMSLPVGVMKMRSLQYDCRLDGETLPDYKVLNLIDFDEFVARQTALRNEETDVDSQVVVMNGESYTLMYRTNKAPDFYTTADDNLLIFDSHDSTVDTTLQKSKTLCQGSIYPAWTHADSFYPDLDPTQFAGLINRAKQRAFKELKQQDNTEAAGEARRQKIVIQKRKRSVPDIAEVYKNPRYGRK